MLYCHGDSCYTPFSRFQMFSPLAKYQALSHITSIVYFGREGLALPPPNTLVIQEIQCTHNYLCVHSRGHLSGCRSHSILGGVIKIRSQRVMYHQNSFQTAARCVWVCCEMWEMERFRNNVSFWNPHYHNQFTLIKSGDS